MSKVPKFQFEDNPPAKPAKVANLHPVEAPTLPSLATLAGGKKENQISSPTVESPQAGGKPISICPKCQGEILLKTSFGKIFCYQCLFKFNEEIGILFTGFNDVDLVLEAAVEKAEERSAILEFDGGLERTQADKTARVLHIQPVVSDLLRRGLIAIEEEVPRAQITTIPPAKPAKVANFNSKVVLQPSSPAGQVTCAAACPWYALNPWTRDPALGAWCHYRMEHLVAGSPACEEFNRGEIPPRLPYGPAVPVTTSQALPESTYTCADCKHFEPNNGPNPRQGRGRCLKRRRGRYGCATACEAALIGGTAEAVM